MQVKHSVTGVVVSADEATLRRLGPQWKPVQPAKKPAEKSGDKK